MRDFTRREAARLASGTLAALGLAHPVANAAPSALTFPNGFKWGCATAAYQIEGAVKEDGRGASIWDVFSHTPGKVANGDTGDIACDGYRRFREDTVLLKGLGAKAYRFSIAWPRIFPQGRGQPNQKGLDHYKQVVDNLLENGIEPYATLFHWDLPAALKGDWRARDTAKAFADYASYIARELSDRVHSFMTTNEIRSFVDLGYSAGIHAPGLRLDATDVNQIRHNAVLAHGLAVQAIRASGRRDTRIGLAENPSVTVPVIETALHVDAARKAMRSENAPFLTAVLEGQYPEDYLASQGAAAPKFNPTDMEAIGSPLDFVALNVYQPTYVQAADNASGYTVVPPPSSYPRMVLPWLLIGPEAIYWAIRLTAELWKPKSIYISENGCASDDKLANGHVEDTDRVMFLRNYLTHLHRAAAENFPIHGYFAWSLMDNFEWAEGYTKRFGIHYVDYASQRRIPKLSALWYRELIASNAVV